MESTRRTRDPGVATSSGVPASLRWYLHACPICGGSSTSHYCRVPSLFTEREFITYERCLSCDVVFCNPRLPDEERLQCYVERPLPPEQTVDDFLSKAHCSQMAWRLRRLLGPGPKRLLDFGCGAGGFLLEARQAGFDVMGLEVCRALAKFVSDRHGISVFSGVVTDPSFAPARFDVIASRQVFEHLTDPKGALLVLKGHLKRPGILLIEVPNLGHIRERLHRGSTMDDSHLFYFTRKSLCGMLTSCGFEILEVAEGLRPYRFFARNGRQLPDSIVRTFETVFSCCQIKTGLSVIGHLR